MERTPSADRSCRLGLAGLIAIVLAVPTITTAWSGNARIVTLAAASPASPVGSSLRSESASRGTRLSALFAGREGSVVATLLLKGMWAFFGR
jgi:hypothetical protein